eukprot:10857559-Karenia_brevis.AAC.1
MGRKQDLWVELSVSNLEYLRLAVLNAAEDAEQRTPRKWVKKLPGVSEETGSQGAGSSKSPSQPPGDDGDSELRQS